MALRPSPVRRIGTLSTLLANSVLYAGHLAHLSTPFGTLLLGGAVLRAYTLPLSIYGDQCLSRTAAALPELQAAHHQYTDIVNHPRAIVWEKRVAAQKLRNDRDRIFRSFRTNNVKMMVPHMVAVLGAWYALATPSQQLGDFFIEEAGMSIVSPLSATAVLAGDGAWSVLRTVDATAALAGTAPSLAVTVDPTLTLAATLTLYNVLQHLRRRTGFNDRLDEYIQDGRRLCWGGYALMAVAGLAAGPVASLTGAATFFPAYVAPVWLGMAALTCAKTLLLNNTRPGRALARIEDYPPQHGTYGGESTAEGHEFRLAFTSVDAEEKRDVWQTQKRALDYECDIRIHKFLSKTGLFDPVEEMEHEAEKLREKRRIAHERAQIKKQKQQQQQKEQQEHEAAVQEESSTEGDGTPSAASPSPSPSPASASPSERRREARAERSRAHEAERQAREAARQEDLAAATAAAVERGEDRWRQMVNVTSPAAGLPASSVKDGEPIATDFAEVFFDEHSADLSQRRLDRAAARAATYQQRATISPAETLLGSREAAEATEAAVRSEEKARSSGKSH